MSRGMSRAERLREMERLYLERGWTDIEMAGRLGVDRTTVFKDRSLLSTECPIEPDDEGRYKIDRSRYLSHIRVNTYEALALYLPARRAARQTLMAQPHVANALEKLSAALKQPMTERLVKAANVILAQTAQPERVAIMETVTRGWIERRKVRIAYRGLRAQQTGHHVVSPYLIEPALWSDGAYVIGYSDYFYDIAVFKIERIESAELKLETFEIPEHFDEQELLRYAWGIWRSEDEPERVKLRFASGDATRRVKETIWHPYQKPIVDTPDGGCIWEALVSEPREMIPWIRGWGADVEVLEPKELRGALVREAQKMAELYQVMETQARQILFYAHSKKGVDKSEWQLLKDHLFKAADLAERFGQDAGISELARTAALLHDLGKYSKAFQARLDGSPRKVDHATAGARTDRKSVV
jgi:CRISPR-associated endonuclease/helicase Cas3